MLGELVAPLDVRHECRCVYRESRQQRQPPVRAPLEHVLTGFLRVRYGLLSVLARQIERPGPGVQEQQRPVGARQQRCVLDAARRGQRKSALDFRLCLLQPSQIL